MNKEIEETIKHCKHLCQQEKKKEREELLKKIEEICNKHSEWEEDRVNMALKDIKKLIK